MNSYTYDMNFFRATIILFGFIITPLFIADAHPGRTASDGCHYCRTNCSSWGVQWDARHCHGGYTAPSTYSPPKTSKPPLSSFFKDMTDDFTRNLTLGSTGYDVQRLQRFLNAEGFAVAVSGPGASGSETTYFGYLTKQALIRYQDANRQSILTPVGLVRGTGFFGPSTMRHIKSL